MSGLVSIETVVAGLSARAGELAAELLPGGRREGRHWRCGDLSGAPGQSLIVDLRGTHAGHWRDFASGEFGDALDLVAQVVAGGDKRRAIAWARAWLGLGGEAPAVDPTRARAEAERRRQRGERDEAARRERARRQAAAIWLASAERLRDTPAEAYLRARAIDLASLGRQPRCLRFHPALYHAETGAEHPALVALITGGEDNRALAVHRTYLARQADGSWGKIAGQAKKVLGPFAGGAIRLWRGASGKPFREAPADEELALVEGVEDGLSLALIQPALRIWAVVSLSNLAAVYLPARLRRVLIVGDNDAGETARAALAKAVAAHQRQGRRVRLVRSPVGKDFNDALRAQNLSGGDAA